MAFSQNISTTITQLFPTLLFQFFWKEFYEYPVPLWFLLNCLGQTFQYMLSGRKRVFLCRVCQVCIIYFNFSHHKTIILFAKLLRQKYKSILNESICIFLGKTSESCFRVKLKEREFWQNHQLSGVLDYRNGTFDILDGDKTEEVLSWRKFF